MKKLILLLVALTFIINITSAYEQNFSQSYLSSGIGVDISSFKYEPYPVEPSEKFTIYLVLKNIGTEYTQDASCKIVDKYPFYSYKDKQKNIGMLAPGREYSFEFEISVDKNAIEGLDYLEIHCTKNPLSDSWLIKKIPIKIQQRYAIFDVVSVKTEPEILPLAKQGKININIMNTAENTVRDIIVELNVQNVPVSPADGTTIKKIKNLNKGEIASLNFNVFTLPDAEPGMYKIPLTINYTDAQGNFKSFSTLITLRISDKPKYYIIVESIEKKSGSTKVNLKFVNNGPVDLKFFNVKILENKYVKLKSNNQIYIGDLDSDDYLTESFLADITKSKTVIPLEITYLDPINNEYTDYINVTWDESKIENKTESSIWPFIIILIIVGILGYYLYRKKRIKIR